MRQLLFRLAVFAVALVCALEARPLTEAAGLPWGSAGHLTASRLLQSTAWIAGAFAAISAINLFLWDGFVSHVARRPVPGLLKNAFGFIVLLGAVTGIVGTVFGRDITAILATSGAVGIVLGFALRNMIQDVFTGIALNLDGSIKAGDWVALQHRDFQFEQYGKVLDINWRTSRIELENRNVVVVPNGLMGMIAVINFAHSDHISRLETEVVVDFDVPPQRARRILLAGAHAAVTEKGILSEPEPQVLVGEPVDRGVVYKVRFWGKVDERSPSSLTDAVMTHLLAHLRVAGLTPALPKEDVFHARQPKRLLEHGKVEDRVEVLSRVPLFGGSMQRRELEALAGSVAAAEFPAGATIVRKGEPGDSMFLVAEGVLDVFVTPPEAEAQVVVGHIAAGQIFGEMSLLTGEPRAASVVAATGVLVYEIGHDQFEALLERRPELAQEISRLVAQRRVATDAAMRDATAGEVANETQRVSEQILTRMRGMFAALRQGRPRAKDAAGAAARA
jgi:small-conductance mechanosensitive channel/CRP-like cAMP-binding protein